MSIQEGATYTRINVKSQTALDLSGGDGKSIIGFGFHGQGNQQVSSQSHRHRRRHVGLGCELTIVRQWVLSKGSSGGWVFRSVATGKYLDIEGAAGDGTPVIASNCSREWDIWPDEENSNAFRSAISPPFDTQRRLH